MQTPLQSAFKRASHCVSVYQYSIHAHHIHTFREGSTLLLCAQYIQHWHLEPGRIQICLSFQWFFTWIHWSTSLSIHRAINDHANCFCIPISNRHKWWMVASQKDVNVTLMGQQPRGVSLFWEVENVFYLRSSSLRLSPSSYWGYTGSIVLVCCTVDLCRPGLCGFANRLTH